MTSAPTRTATRRTATGDDLRLLHVHAHPDDESSKGAAVTAKYVDEGVRVMVATCTGGERGSILNPAMERPDIIAHLPEVRRREMDRARAILGIEQTWLGFMDSGLPEGDPLPPLPEGCFALLDPAPAAGELVRVIREFRPQVLTTYDELGGYPHPDHVQTNRISLVAVEAAADPDQWPEHGEPWQVSKVYYQHTFNRQRTLALHEAMLERGLESPYGERLANWDTWKRVPDSRITTAVECADYFGVRDRALLAHGTQVDPNGAWFQIPLEVQREVWPTEEFELVIDHTGQPARADGELENDLFAGVAIEA
ncbi:mycothiol conjugate amidase Mca [Naumannella sp. ID2617S]|nr:mycothiol conjugate amidase Mca [Naumannella sp. ID2617S]